MLSRRRGPVVSDVCRLARPLLHHPFLFAVQSLSNGLDEHIITATSKPQYLALALAGNDVNDHPDRRYGDNHGEDVP